MVDNKGDALDALAIFCVNKSEKSSVLAGEELVRQTVDHVHGGHAEDQDRVHTEQNNTDTSSGDDVSNLKHKLNIQYKHV